MKIPKDEYERLKTIVREKLKNITTVLDTALEDLFQRRMAFMLILHEKRTDGTDFTVTLTNMNSENQKLDSLNKAAEMVKDPNTQSESGFTTTMQ